MRYDHDPVRSGSLGLVFNTVLYATFRPARSLAGAAISDSGKSRAITSFGAGTSGGVAGSGSVGSDGSVFCASGGASGAAGGDNCVERHPGSSKIIEA